LSEPEEMNAVDGPLAVACKVVYDLVEITECRRGVWPFDGFPKLVKESIPLVSVVLAP